MLGFIVTLSASVAGCFIVQALDIECAGAARQRMSRYASLRRGKAGASYPSGSVAGAR
jgi:hypothetical protein